ncbi:CRISPR-associated protein, Csd1 family [hydrothermal vent metagenome]|uniref:CRISPR-associated protein, Csd1 family n=1 Tax=hydrothermal vent metagenome TaxID=652676 RepID=A0A3B0YWA9_9ZZZZ
MILQALNSYYERMVSEDSTALAPFGFETKELPFIIELNEQGELIQIEDTREGAGKKKQARSFLVPKGVKKTSGVVANLLWDNAEYVLGIDTKGKPERVQKQHQAFIKKIESLPPEAKSDEGIQSVLGFFEQLDITQLETLPVWGELQTNPNLGFRLQGDTGLITSRVQVVKALEAQAEQAPDANALSSCLITGDKRKIARLHSAIKGVWGAQTSGANIVSFNLDAFDSYGKSRGENAPIGERPAFAYTTALNHLLRKNSPQRIQVGDASTVFWADKPTELETQIVDIFGEPSKDDPDRNTNAVKALFKAVDFGRYADDQGKTRFYILGLAPNAARISIRFQAVSTVVEVSRRIKCHFDDLSIEHSDKQLPYLPLFRLLASTAVQGKADNIPPNLAGEVMRSILAETPYPQTLLSAAVRRIRAEREISYPRAAIIKACINRKTRRSNPDIAEELKMSLDKGNTNTGYRLGRLFAVLEKTQEEANPGINATIRDRYYGAASSTPVSVFSTLLKLKNHHLSKIENKGRVTNLEKLYGSIMDDINDFPPVLSLEDQGRFAIGYYHQRQDFFKKREVTDKGEQQ